MNRDKYRELFRLRATGQLPPMECTKSCLEHLKSFLLQDAVYGIWGSYDNFNFLDVPCGTGHYYKVLRDLGDFHYSGVDNDRGMIDIAKEVWNGNDKVSFTVGDVRNLPFPDDKFEIIICYNLLLHLEEGYKKALREMLRVLKEDGRLVIRSLFSDRELLLSIEGTPYNTFAYDDVESFLKTLPDNHSCWFYPDDVKVNNRGIKKQCKWLDLNTSDFTRDNKFKGHEMQYKVLIVDKWRDK
jgi:SAM-dependent methyltransferase